jgi:hypothetical protein
MKRSVTIAIVTIITVACVIFLGGFSTANRIIAILIFSILPSVPIYVLRRRYEKSVSSILEHRQEERLDPAK